MVCQLALTAAGSGRPQQRVLLAVPRSPMMSTPPMAGSTTFSSSASFMSSCPAMHVKGNAGFFRVAASAAGAAAAAAEARVLLRQGRCGWRACWWAWPAGPPLATRPAGKREGAAARQNPAAERPVRACCCMFTPTYS